MPAGSTWMCLLLIVAASMLPGSAQNKATAANPTPVRVWRVGDDSLTSSLRDALENAFQSSPHFTLSAETKPGTLVATIPTHVQWKKIGTRIRLSFRVDFTSIDNKNLGASKGSCWDDAFTKCAAQIVRDAEIAAQRIR